jgi:hypothetical protein
MNPFQKFNIYQNYAFWVIPHSRNTTRNKLPKHFLISNLLPRNANTSWTSVQIRPHRKKANESNRIQIKFLVSLCMHWNLYACSLLSSSNETNFDLTATELINYTGTFRTQTWLRLNSISVIGRIPSIFDCFCWSEWSRIVDSLPETHLMEPIFAVNFGNRRRCANIFVV